MAHIPRSNQVPGHPNPSYTVGHGGGHGGHGVSIPQPVGYSQPLGSEPAHPNDHTYENVAPSYAVKYPPSMGRPISASQQVPVSEITKQLDFATKENQRLKKAVEENNQFLEQRMHEFVMAQNQNHPQVHDMQREKEGLVKEVQRLKYNEKHLKDKVTEATNRFFEARVAVMGFKCKVMQLEGQLHKEGGHANPAPSKALKELEDEKKSLEAVNTQLKEDLEALANKKSIAEEEKERLRQDYIALQQQLVDKEAFIQQLQSQHRQDTHGHTLRGQIQDLMTKKSALEGEVARTKQNNDNLLSKVKEMQESREVMMGKLERLESMSPTGAGAMPVPRPRTSGREQEMQRLQEENASLMAARDQLRLDRDKALQDKAAVNNMFQESNKKSQNLTGENMDLRREIEKLQTEIQRREEELEDEKRRKVEVERNVGAEASQALERTLEESEALQGELRGIRKEKSGLVARVATLERLKKEVEEERDQLKDTKEHLRSQNQKNRTLIAQLEERVAAGVPESADLKSYSSIKNIAAKRLNDALGKIRELETAKIGLVEELEDLNKTKAMKERQLRSQVEGLEEELRVEREEGNKIANEDLVEMQAETTKLRRREQQLSQRIQELESDQQHHVEENLLMRRDMDKHRQDLARDDTAKRDLSRQISEKDSEVMQLREQVRGLQEQLEAEAKSKTKRSTKLDSLQHNLEEQKKRHQVENEEMRTRLHMLEEEKGQVVVDKEELQNTCEEFRKESESILLDYNMCAQRLKVAEETANRMTAQHQKDTTEQARLRERISLLEQSRKEQDDKLNHMDQQIKIYHEDFDRERNAREAAVKVKNLAEDRMKKMDRELKDLRDRLNQQAVRSLREEPYEDGASYSSSSSSSHVDTLPSQRYSGHHTKSGEQYPGSELSTPWNAPSPGSAGGQQHHRAPQQEQRRPADMGMMPAGPGMDPPPSHGQGGGGGYAMGGAGRAYRGGGGGGQMPPNAPWTAINPPSSQPAPHYHPANKTAVDRTLDRPDRTLDRPDRTLDRPDRPLDPMGGHSPSVLGGRRDPMGGTLLPTGQGRMHVEYNQPAGGGAMNDLNNPPSTHMPDMGAINDLSLHRPVPQGSPGRMDFPPLDPSVGRPGGIDPNIGAGGQPLITLPGEINNTAPPTMACPLCNRADFKTQTDLEIHSAQCNN